MRPAPPGCSISRIGIAPPRPAIRGGCTTTISMVAPVSRASSIAKSSASPAWSLPSVAIMMLCTVPALHGELHGSRPRVRSQPAPPSAPSPKALAGNPQQRIARCGKPAPRSAGRGCLARPRRPSLPTWLPRQLDFRSAGRCGGASSARASGVAWTIAWFGGAVIGIVNGATRELVYRDRVGELTAHQISTAVALALFAVYFMALQRRWPLPSRRCALQVGALWVALTLVFEFGFGHWVDQQELGRAPAAVRRQRRLRLGVRPRVARARASGGAGARSPGSHPVTAAPVERTPALDGRGRRVVIAVALANGVGALAGGAGLLRDAEGMGYREDWLRGPFDDYTIPGAFLLVVIGGGMLIVAALAAAHDARGPPRGRRRWASCCSRGWSSRPS